MLERLLKLAKAVQFGRSSEKLGADQPPVWRWRHNVSTLLAGEVGLGDERTLMRIAQALHIFCAEPLDPFGVGLSQPALDHASP
ncbi:hypothetical protein SAMN05216573_12737 [Bradyrhizobium sp. Rc3b]|nr:hypothetical protein SAMN05216573_12737 [Bradyrhizobium sp. Rc3b]